MKKSLITIGLLTAFGSAQAASSVTLYGTINMAYTKKGDSGVTLAPQDNRYISRIGFKGQEDLGKGYSAIFNLQMNLNPDVGSGTYGTNKTTLGFNGESWVGLLTPIGAIRLGRATTPMVNAWIGGDFAPGRGVGEFTGGLAGGGLRGNQPETGLFWNNGLFYDVQKNGFTAGFGVTTKGSESIVPTGTFAGTPYDTSVNTEGKTGAKPAYGAYARYEGTSGLHSYKIGAAYQVDNGSTYAASALNAKNAPAESKNSYLIGVGYGYGPVSLTAGYARANIDNTDLPLSYASIRSGKSTTLFASVAYKPTAFDKLYLSYGRYSRKTQYAVAGIPLFGPVTADATAQGDISGNQWSLGYEHQLSKRTVIYADVRRVKVAKNTCSGQATSAYPVGNAVLGAVSSGFCSSVTSRVDGILAPEKGYGYDIGISHSF